MKRVLIALPVFFVWFPHISHAAIAFDNATKVVGSATSSLTFSHTSTTTGQNLILFVSTYEDLSAPGSSLITGVTYNSAPLTSISSDQRSPDGWETLWYLLAPATGTNDVTVSASSSVAGLRAIAASYTGAKQSGQPDAQVANHLGTNGSSITNTITSVEDNSWHVGGVREEAGTNMTAGSGTTLRTAADTYAWFDNNAAITPAGANSIVASWTGDAPAGFVGATFAPAPAATSTPLTLNRLAKFTATTTPTLGDSLFSDDGSNMTLTAGNLYLQIGSLIDTITGGALNFGTANATSITIGKSGVTTTFPGPLTANGLATFGSNITVPAAFGIDTANAGVLNIGTTTATSITIGKASATTTFPGTIVWAKSATTVNCNSTASPAVCGSAPSGSVAMATGGSTLQVNTSAVTVDSQILITEDSSLGTRLGITCNTATGRTYTISARADSTSFTIKSSNNPVTNKACLSYWVIN